MRLSHPTRWPLLKNPLCLSFSCIISLQVVRDPLLILLPIFHWYVRVAYFFADRIDPPFSTSQFSTMTAPTPPNIRAGIPFPFFSASRRVSWFFCLNVSLAFGYTRPPYVNKRFSQRIPWLRCTWSPPKFFPFLAPPVASALSLKRFGPPFPPYFTEPRRSFHTSFDSSLGPPLFPCKLFGVQFFLSLPFLIRNAPIVSPLLMT